MKRYKWSNCYTIGQLLDNFKDLNGKKRPPESNSVYVITKNRWVSNPKSDSIPLYVGGTTGNSNRFRVRVGDLVADVFGFFNTEPKDAKGNRRLGHHCGGIKLHNYCVKMKISPLDLHIGWVINPSCHRCSELEIYEELNPQLNQKTPSSCGNCKTDV